MATEIKVKLNAESAQAVTDIKAGLAVLAEEAKKTSEEVKSSMDGATKAQDGLAGSIAASVNKYAAGAAAGFTVAGAIAKIGDAAIGMVMAIPEAIRTTGELSDTFKKLSYETGVSLKQLNTFHAAMLLEGQNVQNLEGLFTGSQRAIKANADTLVLNGVAASEAALKSMSFEDYLRRVDELSGQFSNSTERSQFLMAALGKSGIAAGADLHELVERLGEAKELTKDGGPVSDKSIQQMDEAKFAAGRLALAEETYAANVSSHTSSMMTWWNNTRAAMLETGSAQNAINTYVKAGLIHVDQYALGVSREFGPVLATIKALREEWEKIDQVSMDAGVRYGVQNWNTKKFKEPDKPKTTKASTPYVDNEALSLAEMTEWVERYLEKKNDAYAKDAQAAAKYAEKIAKERADYLNEESREQVETQRDALAKINALWERDTVKGGFAAWVRESQQGMKRLGDFTKAAMQSITNAGASSLSGLIKGTMSWGDALKNVLSSALDSLINFFVQWGIQEVSTILMTSAAHKAASTSKVTENAAEAGTAGMKSAAEIPFYGWAIAIGAGLAIFAAAKGLSSAAGGWDRVPSDQMAMIHKDEMVLPARLAEGARQTFAGGRGGGNVYNINALDAKSFLVALRNNKSPLATTLNEMHRDGRKS